MSAALNVGFGGQSVDDLRRQIARRHAGLLAQNHGRIGGNIAMYGVARRLDGHIVKPRPRWQHAGGLQICENAVKPGFKLGKQVHRARFQYPGFRPGCRLCRTDGDVLQWQIYRSCRQYSRKYGALGRAALCS